MPLHEPILKTPSPPPAGVRPALRLQKVLADAGIGSRRRCEEMIAAGRVEVDGGVVTEMGRRVDPWRQQVAVDGVPIPRPKRVYYLVNKPTGVVCTNHDPAGRPRVVDLLPSSAERVYTVGRLDLNSEGLVLLTNDGELADQLMHPRHGVGKVYEVQVAGEPSPQVFAQLRRGVQLAEGPARVSQIHFKSRHGRSSVLRITLQEGRNREVRRLLARVGHKVMKLRRVAIGPLRLKDLPIGQYRKLHDSEVRALRRFALHPESAAPEPPSADDSWGAPEPSATRSTRAPNPRGAAPRRRGAQQGRERNFRQGAGGTQRGAEQKIRQRRTNVAGRGNRSGGNLQADAAATGELPRPTKAAGSMPPTKFRPQRGKRRPRQVVNASAETPAPAAAPRFQKRKGRPGRPHPTQAPRRGKTGRRG